MLQSVLPDERAIPLEARPALKKSKIRELDIVLPLLFVAVVVVVPNENMPLVAVSVGDATAPAPASILLLSIVLLSLPLAPVVVLNNTAPEVVEGNNALSIVYLSVLLEPSFIKRTAVPPTVVLVLAIVRSFEDPTPPCLPSIIQ